MKNKMVLLATLCVFLFCFCTIIAEAQSQRPLKKQSQRPKINHPHSSGRDTLGRKSVFMSYPTNFVATTLKTGFEFKVAPYKSLALIASLGGADYGTSQGFYQVNSFNEFGIEAQLRFYINKDRPALNGLYLAPYTFFKSMTYAISSTDAYGNPTTNSYNVSDFSLGYLIGYQFIFNSSITLNVFLGGGENIINGNKDAGSLGANPYGYPKGIMIHTGAGLGIAF